MFWIVLEYKRNEVNRGRRYNLAEVNLEQMLNAAGCPVSCSGRSKPPALCSAAPFVLQVTAPWDRGRADPGVGWVGLPPP